MSNRALLEVCVESVDHAAAAERGGAHRIELCTDLWSGGITPSTELMQTARRRVRIPIHVLIRPRAGDFCYSDSELGVMHNEIRAAKQFGVDGIVLGILRDNAGVDVQRTRALVELARPLPVTFHRAFDCTHDFEAALEEVIQTGASRILTSAGRSHATDGLQTLAGLIQKAKGRILIMPCGGINSDNILTVVRTTFAQEIHSSVGTSHAGRNSCSGQNSDSCSAEKIELFEQKVVKLVSLLADL
jgi:copper homeostasis protein